MSRRTRMTWKTRTADPYSMNQDRSQPAVEEYMTGEPSAWAEDVVTDLDHFENEPRNEINQPAKSTGETVREANIRQAKMQRHYEKKALQCVRIASLLLPGASEDLIAEQALDLMPLPSDVLVATSLRIAESEMLARLADEDEKDEDAKDEGVKDSSKKEDEEDESEKDASCDDKEEDEGESKDEDKEAKKASKSTVAMLREMLAAAKKDEEDESEKDASCDDKEEDESEKEEDESEKDASCDDKEEDESEKDASCDEKEEDESEKDASKEASDDKKECSKEEDEDTVEAKKASHVDALLAELQAMDNSGGDMSHGDDLDAMLMDFEEDGMDIDMTPSMDTFDEDSMMMEGSDLDVMMGGTYGARSASTKGKKPVQSLGGRVKESSNTGGGDLSNLWDSAPDVSGVFGSGNY